MFDENLPNPEFADHWDRILENMPEFPDEILNDPILLEDAWNTLFSLAVCITSIEGLEEFLEAAKANPEAFEVGVTATVTGAALIRRKFQQMGVIL